jgi:hypothetical protein
LLKLQIPRENRMNVQKNARLTPREALHQYDQVIEQAITRSLDLLREHGASRGVLETQLGGLLEQYRIQRVEICAWIERARP